jgi:hypothetical protein|tara:strand:+ start:1839 stop:2300 length:462 start_codon:yes stop_codon:yes gene_type:complete
MKSKTKTQMLSAILIVLVVAVIYMWRNPKVVKVSTTSQLPVTPRPVSVRREPEFRGPPIKKYKPGQMQQMGIITGAGDVTMPLYGKEVRGRRDRYHYYTTTPGQQIYPIPLSHNARDCMEDIGCQELYGNETVSVTGKTGSFAVKMYRTDNFF